MAARRGWAACISGAALLMVQTGFEAPCKQPPRTMPGLAFPDHQASMLAGRLMPERLWERSEASCRVGVDTLL